jgi:hypothetical protein
VQPSRSNATQSVRKRSKTHSLTMRRRRRKPAWVALYATSRHTPPTLRAVWGTRGPEFESRRPDDVPAKLGFHSSVTFRQCGPLGGQTAVHHRYVRTNVTAPATMSLTVAANHPRRRIKSAGSSIIERLPRIWQAPVDFTSRSPPLWNARPGAPRWRLLRLPKPHLSPTPSESSRGGRAAASPGAEDSLRPGRPAW